MTAVLPGVAMQRRLTAAFVARAPVEVELEAAVVADDGEGGRAVVRGLPRPPVVVTLCEPGSSSYGPQAVSTDGARTLADWLLVGAWDVDVRAGDEFTLDGSRYRVGTVLPANGWEARAYVTLAGKTH